jgi:hypothetical protein
MAQGSAQSGVKGPQGPQGPQGAQGPVGATPVYPWEVNVNLFTGAISNNNMSTIYVNSDIANMVGPALVSGTGAQGESSSYRIMLSAGTWQVNTIGYTANNRGIYNFYLDNVLMGTVDGYSASPTVNVRRNSSSFVVASTAVYTLKMAMDTKNASASTYYSTINMVTFVRLS